MAAGASELQKAVDKLLKREPGWRRAITPPDKGAKPGGTSVGRPASGAGGGLELVEDDASTREYHPAPLILRSADGILTVEVEAIKTVRLRGNLSLELAMPPQE